MRRKKERSKQGQTNKQGKATQHTQVHVRFPIMVITIITIGNDNSNIASVLWGYPYFQTIATIYYTNYCLLHVNQYNYTCIII